MSEAISASAAPASPASDEIMVVSGNHTAKIKAFPPSKMFDIVEMAQDAATNQTWMKLATALHSVVELDGVPVVIPMTKPGLRAFVDKLGNDLWARVLAAIYPVSAEIAADHVEVAAKN